MKNILDEEILDSFYNLRKENFEILYAKKYGEEIQEKEKAIKTEYELKKLIIDFVVDATKREKILLQLNDFEDKIMDEIAFWDRQYYKLGFTDAICLREQIERERFIRDIKSNNDKR